MSHGLYLLCYLLRFFMHTFEFIFISLYMSCKIYLLKDIYTYIHTYIYVCVYVRTCIYVHIYTYIYIHTYMCVCVCIYIYLQDLKSSKEVLYEQTKKHTQSDRYRPLWSVVRESSNSVLEVGLATFNNMRTVALTFHHRLYFLPNKQAT